MIRGHVIVAAWLACGATIAADTATAQPRAEPEPDLKASRPVTEPGELGAWLQRLVGKFRFDGMVKKGGDCVERPAEGPPPPPNEYCQIVKGRSDCTRIGEGPGVQCIFNVTWLDIFNVDFGSGTATPVLVSYLDPAMQLIGLDPRHSTLEHMIVDNKGLPEGGPGYVKGDVAEFRSPCGNTPVGCYHIIRIEAKPDARRLYWWLIDDPTEEPPITYGVFTLLRLTEEEATKEFKAHLQ